MHQQKARKKLNCIRHLNDHLDFSSGFQVIDPSNYKKMLRSRKIKPGHRLKNRGGHLNVLYLVFYELSVVQVIFSKIELEISPLLTVIQFYN